jgi:ubiquitin carboxyl-terminal hydrolase 8
MTKYNERHVATPPLRGVFSNTLYQPPSPSNTNTIYTMPIPRPSSPTTTDVETFATKYPDIRPNISNLQRKKTFIDNPFHGFTSTTNKQFDVPPLPPKPQQPLPQVPDTAATTTSTEASAPPLPPKGVYASSPPINNAYRTAPVSDNSFSQMGNVMIGTTGLKNLGNTCFMNSIIQCLSGTIPFARYFISGVFRQHINKENFLGTGGVLADNFASLLRTMWSENYNFISPVLFREALIKFAPQFRGSEQHDSQEFLNFLLDGIHEDCNLVRKRPTPPPESAEEEARFEQLPDWQASGIAWERYLERNSSVIVSLFQGQYRSRLTCLTCYAVSKTFILIELCYTNFSGYRLQPHIIHSCHYPYLFQLKKVAL